MLGRLQKTGSRQDSMDREKLAVMIKLCVRDVLLHGMPICMLCMLLVAVERVYAQEALYKLTVEADAEEPPVVRVVIANRSGSNLEMLTHLFSYFRQGSRLRGATRVTRDKGIISGEP